jgi:hypothetical protein
MIIDGTNNIINLSISLFQKLIISIFKFSLSYFEFNCKKNAFFRQIQFLAKNLFSNTINAISDNDIKGTEIYKIN